MRVFATFLASCLMAGCASKPNDYLSPSLVTIPKTATYWLATFNVDVVGKNQRFLFDDAVRAQLIADLTNHLPEAGRYASSKETADYLLGVSTSYASHVQGNSDFEGFIPVC